VKRCAIFLVALAMSGAAIAQSDRAQPDGDTAGAHARNAERAVVVEAHPLSGFAIFDSAKRQFGKLTFLGGLELRGRDPAFGGISGAIIDPDGRGFLAITDQAHWISGRFTTDGETLTGVEGVRIAPMLAPNGRRMKDTRWFDSEGLTRRGNQIFVSVERVHAILRFEMANGRPVGRGTVIDTPPAMRQLNSNQGIESLGVMPARSAYAGAFIAIAERGPKTREDGASTPDTIPGWLIGGSSPGEFAVKRKDDFDITDVGFLPGGDMLILERRFAAFTGIAFRIRRIPLASVKPGALLDGETLIQADMSHHIDNMEALMIHRADDGRVILTLMSDDNFNLLQRNLVLRFAYQE
jgi:hypothetical protein